MRAGVVESVRVRVCVRAHRGGEDGVYILGNLSDHAPTKSLQRALVAFNFTASLFQCFSSRTDLSTWGSVKSLALSKDKVYLLTRLKG